MERRRDGGPWPTRVHRDTLGRPGTSRAVPSQQHDVPIMDSRLDHARDEVSTEAAEVRGLVGAVRVRQEFQPLRERG